MNFIVEPTLIEHMQRTGKNNIVVEMVTAETSDIEISELHVYLANDKQATFFKEKKRYRGYAVEEGEVLLPAFPLQYEENVRFWLKTFLCFKTVGYEGIKI